MNLHTRIGRLALTVLALAAIPAAAAHAQARPAIVLRAEQCLRRNVDKVVANERDLASAANFLVNFACAGEVAGAARYQRNSAYVQMFSTVFKMAAQGGTPAAKAVSPLTDFKASVDPETGEIVVPPSAPGSPPNPITTLMPMMEAIVGQVTPESVPVALRKLTGELVMAAHERAAAAAH
jgi:hypothetical protein